VNDELGAIQEGVPRTFQRIIPGGRLAIISFHSVEDRAIKRILRGFVERGEGVLEPRRPIVPSREEIGRNPRSRSAKLRIIRKLESPLQKP